MNKPIVIPMQSLSIALALLAASTQVYAVDGQVLINMSKAAAGGTTPGDAPGFPVTISRPGSYRLSGNLTVPNADTDVIQITASHVTFDLNGFAILGPTNCAGGFPCAGSGTGNGITTGSNISQFNITVRNGTIQGMGNSGIFLIGDSHLIEYTHVRSNGSTGISISASADNGSSIVQYNTAQRNGTDGIWLSRGAVSHNVTDLNRSSGITLITGTASYNVSTRNGFSGLTLNNAASFLGNTLTENGFVQVYPQGVNMGQNLCNNVVCPGAKY